MKKKCMSTIISTIVLNEEQFCFGSLEIKIKINEKLFKILKKGPTVFAFLIL